jgi:hypothetical protein
MSNIILAKRRSGGAYRVEFVKDSGRIRIRCSCDAGSIGRLCRHKRALIIGNTRMLSDQDQTGELQQILAWPEMQVLGQRARKYEKELAEIESRKKLIEDEEQTLLLRYANDCLDGVHEA